MAKTRNRPGAEPPLDAGVLPGLLGYQLRRAQTAVFQHFAETVGTRGISPGQFGVLVLIEANPGLSQTALARALGLDRSSVVPVIDHLEARSLVARHRREGDRRTYALDLTARGAHELAGLKRAVTAHEAAITEGLSASERAQLVATLDRIATRLSRPLAAVE